MKFLFDTADLPELKKVWNDLKNDVNPSEVLGITTNPAIMQRAGKNSLKDWLETYKELQGFIEDNHFRGKLHVQPPSSKMDFTSILFFHDLVYSAIQASCVLKIPPSYRTPTDFPSANCTGLTEAGTMLKMSIIGAEWVSIIPGRMIPQGLSYTDHISFFVDNCPGGTKCIAGALRDTDQTVESIKAGAIPTLGLKTWRYILDNNNLEEVLGTIKEYTAPVLMPLVCEKNTNLSNSFFEEMDGYGKQAASELSLFGFV